jgi:protein-tyrosine kinase
MAAPMKTVPEILPAGEAAARVHVVKPQADAPGPDARPQPLHIDYTTTCVLPEARLHLLSTPGIVRSDGSELAEAFKMLRSQVLLRMQAEGHRLIGISSPRRGPGKSLAAANLALSMAADLDTSVLLVDVDLTGLGVQSVFGLDGRPGLIEHLLRDAPLAELLVNPGIERLVVLPAGQGPIRNSAELLASRTLQHLLQEVRRRYDDRIIVVDLPPLLDSADALAFLPQVDSTLVVVENDASSIRDLEAASELLAPFNLMGTVLSPAPPRQPRRAWYRRWRG